MLEVLDKNIITRTFTPKTEAQRLIEWNAKMTVRDPLRVIVNESRAAGLAVKKLWLENSAAKSHSFSKEHKANES